MLKPWRRPAAPLIPFCLLLAMLPCGCAPAPQAQPAATVTAPPDSSCSAFRQLSWSVRDTTETSTEVRRHNQTYAALCPKREEIAAR